MNFFEEYKDEIMAFFKAFYELVVTIFGKLTGTDGDPSDESGENA